MSFSAQEVLITEHLTFPPLSLIDDIINTANALLYKSVSAMETLFRSLPPEVLPEEEVESGIHKFETLLESAVDRNFDAFELFVLRNVVTVPPELVGWLRLAHHDGIDLTTAAVGPGAEGAEEELDDELARVRKTYAAALRVQEALVRERALVDRQARLLEKHAAELAFIETAAKAAEVAPIRDNADFLRDQVRALRGGLDEVRKVAARTIGGSVEDAEKAMEPSDRSRYIERVLLETVPEGSFEKQAAELEAIGSVEDMRRAADLLTKQQ